MMTTGTKVLLTILKITMLSPFGELRCYIITVLIEYIDTLKKLKIWSMLSKFLRMKTSKNNFSRWIVRLFQPEFGVYLFLKIEVFKDFLYIYNTHLCKFICAEIRSTTSFQKQTCLWSLYDDDPRVHKM